MNVVQTREGLLDYTDDLRKQSFDLYSTYKSSYLQNRKKKVVDTLE
jgi:ABC-type transporter lipoprotein component MlaA